MEAMPSSLPRVGEAKQLLCFFITRDGSREVEGILEPPSLLIQKDSFAYLKAIRYHWIRKPSMYNTGPSLPATFANPKPKIQPNASESSPNAMCVCTDKCQTQRNQNAIGYNNQTKYP